jgi:peptidoglycan/xylan/chitin deacetylase (PgdA/CDA1 family)
MSAPAITITTSWDDGHPLDLRLADLLSKYDLPATFYVPIESERGVLSKAQIRQLAARFEIGAHTIHHLPVTHLPPEDAWREIVDSRQAIRDITGAECRSFCFPWGKYQAQHLSMTREAGFTYARTVEMLSLDRPRSRAGVLVMPTTVQSFSHSASAMFRNIAKRAAFTNALRWMLRSRRLDWVDLARTMLHVATQHGGVFHLWGHSWEIEEHQQWGRLEAIFRLLAPLRTSARFCTNSQVLSTDDLTAHPHRS